MGLEIDVKLIGMIEKYLQNRLQIFQIILAIFI
jgi:hypothetical protein